MSLSFDLLEYNKKSIEESEDVSMLLDNFVNAVEDFPQLEWGEIVQKKLVELLQGE